MKISLEQMKAVLGDKEKNLKKMLELINKAIKDGKDMIVFPELSLCGNLLENLVYENYIKEVPKDLLEKSKEISIIFGAVELSEDMFLYNSAYYLENGEIMGKQRKINLSSSKFNEHKYFKRAEEVQTFNSKFGKIAILIGEDSFSMGNIDKLSKEGTKYIFNVASTLGTFNSEGIGSKNNIETVLKASSICNSLYNIYCNRIGVEDGLIFMGNSFIVDPFGNIISESEQLEETSLDAELHDNNILRAKFMNKNLLG